MTGFRIRTGREFQAHIKDLVENEAYFYQHSMESYLRSLWRLVNKHRGERVTYDLIARLLKEAFSQEPLPFDETWFNYEYPPYGVDDTRLIEDDFHFLQELILYQIAELNRMQTDAVPDEPPEFPWLGVPTQNGEGWYNFHPGDFLESAVALMPADADLGQANWADLGHFLRLGQIYA
jgi:hypothetical protein